jgi:hypothetical protein
VIGQRYMRKWKWTAHRVVKDHNLTSETILK